MGHRDQARTRMVQFHQAYAYEDFIQGYRPHEGGGFVRRDGPFYNFAKLAETDPDRPYVFIIDEINRGNLSKVLGELMMLIEPDKRGDEYALPLTYGRPEEEPFHCPRQFVSFGLNEHSRPFIGNGRIRFTTTLRFSRARAELQELQVWLPPKFPQRRS